MVLSFHIIPIADGVRRLLKQAAKECVALEEFIDAMQRTFAANPALMPLAHKLNDIIGPLLARGDG